VNTLRRNGHLTQQCAACGKPFARNLMGRKKVFCSAACRLEGHRTNKISSPGHPAGLQRNDSSCACGSSGKSPAKSESSLFANGPLNILGGGSWRWPEAGSLDAKTLTKITHSEIGEGSSS
jgi:hypothetical protein